jgi:hypothetical protein
VPPEELAQHDVRYSRHFYPLTPFPLSRPCSL